MQPMTDEQVARLQAGMDAVRASVEAGDARWRQSTWGYVRNDEKLREGVRSVVGYDTLRNNGDDPTNCRTAFCLAGHVDLQNGFLFASPEFGSSQLECVLRESDADDYLSGALNNGDLEWADDAAADLLGFDSADSLEAEVLFEAGNTYEALWLFAYVISGRRLALPADLDLDVDRELRNYRENLPEYDVDSIRHSRGRVAERDAEGYYLATVPA